MFWFIAVLGLLCCWLLAAIYVRLARSTFVAPHHPAHMLLAFSVVYHQLFMGYAHGPDHVSEWQMGGFAFAMFFGVPMLLIAMSACIHTVYDGVCDGRPYHYNEDPASAWMTCLAGTFLMQCIATAAARSTPSQDNILLPEQVSGTITALFAVTPAVMVPWHLEFIMWQWTTNDQRKSWWWKAMLSLGLVLTPVAFTIMLPKTTTTMTWTMVGQQVVLLCTGLIGCVGTCLHRTSRRGVAWVESPNHLWLECGSLLGTLSSLARNMYKAAGDAGKHAQILWLFTLLQALAFVIAVQVNLSLVVVPNPVPGAWKTGMKVFKFLGMVITLLSWVVEWQVVKRQPENQVV